MKKTGISGALLLVFSLLFLLAPGAGAEKTDGGFIGLLRCPGERTLGIAFRGDTENYPENTLEGIISAQKTGIDACLVNVSFTSDGVAVLFADETAERTCGSNGKIAELTFDELSEMPLKNSEGGVYEKTDCRVPSLENVLTECKKLGFSLVISCRAQEIAAVTELLKKTDTLSLCALTVNDTAENIENGLKSCKNAPVIIGEIRNNIIFKLTSYENKIEALGGAAVTLRTTNRYGVNYYKSHLALLDGRLRAVADLSDTLTAGSRCDCEKWWDDLISRGYSVIITREPAKFADYLKRTQNARDGLEAELKKAEDFPLPEFKKEFLNDYIKAYNDAVAQANSLLADKSSALANIDDTTAALKKALIDINLNYEGLEDGSAGLNVTPASIFLCCFAAALVLSAEIYTYRKRKK